MTIYVIVEFQDGLGYVSEKSNIITRIFVAHSLKELRRQITKLMGWKANEVDFILDPDAQREFDLRQAEWETRRGLLLTGSSGAQ